jgi:drug/metabolite transporter superfamily protein YnfA
MKIQAGRIAMFAIFAAAAVLEVAGDALVRRGLRGGGFLFLALGVAALGSYSVALNLIDLDFSRLLGAYVGIFALASVVIGRVVFRDQVPLATWAGLAIVLCGSLVIQLGASR